MQTVTVILKDTYDETHRFEQVANVIVDNERYLAVHCENGVQFLFKHSVVREVEIQPNEQGGQE